MTIQCLQQQETLVTEFDTELWYTTVDWLEITKEQDVVFKGGYTVRVPMASKQIRKSSIHAPAARKERAS